VETTPWVKKGAVWRRETDSTALLARQSTTSFLADFDYSVNPLAGCPFSCDDCYVPALPAVKFRRDVLPDGQRTNTTAAWGSWVEVRTRSVEVLRHALDQGKLDGATLFMSPVSDVYWPGEREYRLTRALLEALVERPVIDWLLISTRSQLVCRDIDLLQRLGNRVEVGISIPTDREDVKAVFGRQNPSLAQRFQAARELVAAGVPTRIHVAPLQPHTPAFAERLADAAHWIWLDWHAHLEAGFPALYAAHGWHPSSPEDVAAFAEQLRGHIQPGRVRIGQAHFADRWQDARRETQQLSDPVQIAVVEKWCPSGARIVPRLGQSSPAKGPKMDRNPTAPNSLPRLRIEAWRRAFALSQRSLADYAGLDRKTIRRVEEQGDAQPETVRQLAGVFRVTPWKLYQDPRHEDIGNAVPQRMPKRKRKRRS